MPASPTRPRAHEGRGFERRRPPHPLGIAQLAVSLLLAACAIGPPSEVLAPGPLRVRIGQIDPIALEAAANDPPRDLRERIDYLVDLFWKAGCPAVEMPHRDEPRYSDVACSLPGRTSDRIVVVARLERSVDENGTPR